MKGKPLPGATVTFAPTAPGGRPAVAITGEDGRFTLTTHLPDKRSGAGAMPGDYKVTISKFVPPDGMSEDAYAAKAAADAAAREKGGYNPNETLPGKVEGVPPAFSAADKTKLTATVSASGPNEFTFDIP
jgi:hypothetical protein